MPRLSHSLFLAAAVAAFALAAAGPASAKTVWLCSPTQKSDPCDYGLASTVIAPDGTRSAEAAPKTAKSKVDCFYVYPTVSDQSTPNATLAKDPEVRAIATYQASRFSQTCRMFAPMYRQLTLAGIFNPANDTPAAQAKAYNDVRSAFKDFLKHDNKNRGFVLIGHSQGSFVLRRLITDEIDGKPAVRRRMVSALLLGGNTTTKEFKKVHACTKPGQTRCIVAWSMFHDPPPADSTFGRTKLTGQRVVCTSPGKLGSSAALVPYQPSLGFPGTIGASLAVFAPGQPTDVTTPWFAQPGRFTATCASTADGASYLKVDGSPMPTPVPNPGWGLHLGDVNLALGNLTTIVRKQVAAYR
jgi:hypothetical protein